MNRMLHRLGAAAATHPWRTISAWIVVVVVAFGLAGAFGGTAQDDYDIPDARAQVGIDQLRAHAPHGGGTTAQVVVHDPSGARLEGAALDALAERGLRRVNCEGGPTLLAQVLAAGRLDELDLTVSPLLVGGRTIRVLDGDPLDPPQPLRLGQVLEEDGFLFMRYLRGEPR